MGQPLNKKDFKNLLAAASSNMEWALDAAKTLPMTGRTAREIKNRFLGLSAFSQPGDLRSQI